MDAATDDLTKIREKIHQQISSANLLTCIDKTISDVIHNCGIQEPVPESCILDDLKRKGIIDDVVRQLQINLDGSPKQLIAEEKTEIPTRGCYLVMKAGQGRAFLEHLEVEPHLAQSKLQVSVHFRGQRFQSRCVPVCCEPKFSDDFIFELKSPCDGSDGCCDVGTLLSICDPIHIVVLRHDSDGSTTIVSSYALEWRNALAVSDPPFIKVVELMGVGCACKVPAGIVDVQLQVLPHDHTTYVSPKVVEAQIHLEKQRCCERERLFLVYAKQWWKEYTELRKEHELRPVKIFAQDENGVNRVVCAFVQPLKDQRLLSCPQVSARFVSTFSCERTASIGSGTKDEYWQSLHSFLRCKKGNPVNHSNLLCSLLLGFGLDAYVCFGRSADNLLSCWVLTRYFDETTVFMWDPVTGRRYSHYQVDFDEPPATRKRVSNHPFKSIGCAYNHKSFYANIQPTDMLANVVFSFDNPGLWKCMNFEMISSVTGLTHPNICTSMPPLISPTLNGVCLEKQMEKEIKLLVSQHRKDLDMMTEWDDNLGYLLGQSLVSYETEKCWGLANIGNDDFQDAIKRTVPEGNTFKGFPLQLKHCNASQAFKTCLKNKVCLGIVQCRGDNVRLAVRSHVTVFPDDLVAVWIIIACRYRSVI